jgi:hypothetical protein
MVKEYEVRDTLEEASELMAGLSSNPTSWLSWVIYFLSQLERQAMDVNPSYQQRYDDMLSMLQDSIHNRRRTGGW